MANVFLLYMYYVLSSLKTHLLHTAEFMRAVKEDAKEREKNRKERETLGREFKNKGNEAFRSGQHKSAVDFYTQALRYTPWDISLYTNKALVSMQEERIYIHTSVYYMSALFGSVYCSCRLLINWVNMLMQSLNVTLQSR